MVPETSLGLQEPQWSNTGWPKTINSETMLQSIEADPVIALGEYQMNMASHSSVWFVTFMTSAKAFWAYELYLTYYQNIATLLTNLSFNIGNNNCRFKAGLVHVCDRVFPTNFIVQCSITDNSCNFKCWFSWNSLGFLLTQYILHTLGHSVLSIMLNFQIITIISIMYLI